MPQSTVALQAPPLGRWDPPTINTGSTASAMPLGTEALLLLARALSSQGWNLQEVDLRDAHRQPISTLEHDLWIQTIRDASTNSDHNLLHLSSMLPHHISSIRLRKGTTILKLQRTGSIEFSGLEASLAAAIADLDLAIRKVWA